MLVFLLWASCGHAAERYNLVLMVSDDHGREALGCYGNPVVKTPNLDALAEQGTRFSNAYCTSASCSASRSVILTGLQNHANGAYGHTHDYHHFSCFSDLDTLPSLLKAAGYRTGRVGKKHYAPDEIFPFDFSPKDRRSGRNDRALAEECREFIDGEEPFFLYWCSFDPHRSGRVVEEHPLRPNAFGNPDKPFSGDYEQTYTEDEVIVPPFLNDSPGTRAELAQYYQSVSRLDRGIGRLVQLLKDAGKYENTIIMYISDNGSAFPGSKTTLYEPGIRLPCIVRVPGMKGGVVNDGLISWADILPTFLDVAGETVERSLFHGQSFRGLLGTSDTTGWRNEVYASHTFHEITDYYPMRMIRTPRYKLIKNIAWQLPFPIASDLAESATWQAVSQDPAVPFGARTVGAFLNRPRYELYDLQNDPDESVNLAGNPEFRAVMDELCGKLRKFQETTRDPWLNK